MHAYAIAQRCLDLTLDHVRRRETGASASEVMTDPAAEIFGYDNR